MGKPANASGASTPGSGSGAVTGVLAGVLLSAVWALGAWDVALALTAVFVGLVVTLVLGVPSWRPFGLGMVAAAAVVGAAAVLVLV